jgi:hypothetical protein
MGKMRKITVEQFHTELKAQGVSAREHTALKCPACGTVQSIALLLSQGCPAERVETQIGFSCVGRWNDAGPPSRDGKPAGAKPGCNWTLGGLFRIHTLEVEMDGKVHPIFEPATADEAQALERSLQNGA